ncbi:MAG TPA: Ppx/GppA phosphatase family protein [Nitrospiria bacterium]|nr:Ppx/GppA phosphatase family protein [Nitrospiria bacterium]
MGSLKRPAFGSVDVGSNTSRYMVAEVWKDDAGPVGDSHPPRVNIRELRAGREIVRLGEGLSKSGVISEGAMGRAIDALRRFRSEMKGLTVERVAVVATSAVREAANRRELIERVRNEIGWNLEVVSGEEEARLSYLGICAGLREFPEDALLVDVGGGSTELIRIRGGKVDRCVSLHLGVVHLTERYLTSDPVGPTERERVRQESERVLREGLSGMSIGTQTDLIGTAGTVTTLAAIDQGMVRYDPERVNGYRLSRDTVEKWLLSLSSLPLAERRKIPVMELGREDVIVAGTIVTAALMDLLDKQSLRVSEYGLREGVLYNLFLEALSKRSVR